VSIGTAKDRARIWKELKFCGERIKKQLPGARIMLTANDEEDLTPDAEITVSEMNSRLNTTNLDKITGLIQKALNEQDALTYSGVSSEGQPLAGDTAVEILKALQ
jgi:hypothetical protein